MVGFTPRPPYDSSQSKGNVRWPLVAKRADTLDMTGLSMETWGSGDRLIAEELRGRGSVTVWEAQCRKRLARTSELLRCNGNRIVKLIIIEDDSRADLVDSEEQQRIMIFLDILQSIEDKNRSEPMPKRLAEARRFCKTTDMFVSSENDNRTQHVVDERSERQRIEFLSNFSRDIALRYGLQFHHERQQLCDTEERIRSANQQHQLEDLSTAVDFGKASLSHAASQVTQLPFTANVFSVFDNETSIIHQQWVELTAEIASKMHRDRVSWTEYLVREEHQFRKEIIQEEACWSKEYGIHNQKEQHDDEEVPGPSETEQALLETVTLEECYRQVWIERESLSKIEISDLITSSNERCTKAAATYQARSIVPPQFAELFYSKSIQCQSIECDEYKSSLLLSTYDLTTKVKLRHRRILQKQLSVPSIAEMIMEARTTAEIAKKKLLKEFNNLGTNQVEDEAMKYGLTYGWDALQNIAWFATTCLEAELSFLIEKHLLEMCFLAEQRTEPIACESKSTLLLQSIPNHLFPLHLEVSREIDSLRDQTAEIFMNFVADSAFIIKKLLDDYTSTLDAIARTWWSEARFVSLAEVSLAWEYFSGLVENCKKESSLLWDNQMINYEKILQKNIEIWHLHSIDHCSDIQQLEIDWCTREQKALATACCVGVEMARKRVEGRSLLRQACAQASILLGDFRISLQQIDNDHNSQIILNDTEMLSWSSSMNELIDEQHVSDPYQASLWKHDVELFKQNSLYILQRSFYLILQQSADEILLKEQYIKETSEKYHLDNIYSILDTEEVSQLVTRGEDWLGMTRGSDKGGIELERLRIVKQESTIRRDFMFEEQTCRKICISELGKPTDGFLHHLNEAIEQQNQISNQSPPEEEYNYSIYLSSLIKGHEVIPDSDQLTYWLQRLGSATITSITTLTSKSDLRYKYCPVIVQKRLQNLSKHILSSVVESSGLAIWVSAQFPYSKYTGMYFKKSCNTFIHIGYQHVIKKLFETWHLLEEDNDFECSENRNSHPAAVTVHGEVYKNCGAFYGTKPVYKIQSDNHDNMIWWNRDSGHWVLSRPGVSLINSNINIENGDWITPSSPIQTPIIRSFPYQYDLPSYNDLQNSPSSSFYISAVDSNGNFINDGIITPRNCLQMNKNLIGVWNGNSIQSPSCHISVRVLEFSEQQNPWFSFSTITDTLRIVDGSTVCYKTFLFFFFFLC